MSLQEKIKNCSTELQEFYEIAQRDIEKHKANITRLNKELKEEQEKLYSSWELKDKCERRAEEQGYPNLFNRK